MAYAVAMPGAGTPYSPASLRLGRARMPPRSVVTSWPSSARRTDSLRLEFVLDDLLTVGFAYR